ncbi:MAG: thrombospondin type 3 repeat-containing protein [Gammaproteobacteria bacterium]|nr:thrombospondin type 3 repeat-containing protein [Gammaproteobacteria bacterium]
MRKASNLRLLILLAIVAPNISQADSTAWVNGDLVRTFDGTTHGGVTGTITIDDWDFVGPNGRTIETFEPINGFGNGTYNASTAASCIANPASCGIGQRQHVVTTGPDGITQDPPRDILGDFLSPNGPYPQANVDSLTTFFRWGYTTVAGSTFSNMLIDFDGDYQIAKNDMAFEFYNVIDYQQVVPDGATRTGTVADGPYDNKLAFQPYALTDAKGWCGSIMAAHPNAHEAMAGQVTFDVAFDVYFKNADGSYTYWSTEITKGFQMRSFGDVTLDITLSDGIGKQEMSARAIVNNTDPNVINQSVGPDTPVGDPALWHNRVSFMGADIIPGGAGTGDCGVLTAEWIAGQRGPGIKKFDSLIPDIADSAACTAAGGSWQTAAFAGYAYILRADGMRIPDYFDESVYGPDPMTLDSDNDGVVDYADNCTTVANPDQQDTDADNYGNACDADFNNDNLVNSLDLGLFKQMFFSTGDVEADMNGDQIVNSLDLGLFKASFFQSPGPSATAQ